MQISCENNWCGAWGGKGGDAEEGSGHQAPSFSCLSRGSKRQQRRSVLKPSDRPDLSLFKVQGFMEERKLKWTKTPIHIIAECVHSILSLSLQGSKGVHNLQMSSTALPIGVPNCTEYSSWLLPIPTEFCYHPPQQHWPHQQNLTLWLFPPPLPPPPVPSLFLLLLFVCLFGYRVLAQADSEFTTSLPPPPEC